MNSIKSFAYLDDYKMYSISSQIFEGMTEYIIKSNTHGNINKDEQKGNIGTGRTMAELIEKQKNETEKVFLHDYSYNLFEAKLLEEYKVLEVNETLPEDWINKISAYNFIKVTGKVIFNDTLLVENMLRTFNKLGLAITSVTTQDLKESNNTLISDIQSAKDKNQKAKLEATLKTKVNSLKELAKSRGLQLNENVLEDLSHLVNYGYNGQFEIQIPFNDELNKIIFSAIVKRDKLKENETLLIKKFGRFTQKKFTLFGILTQTEQSNNQEMISNLEDGAGVKEAIRDLVARINNIESVFLGKLNREIVIDPIALYQEIS